MRFLCFFKILYLTSLPVLWTKNYRKHQVQGQQSEGQGQEEKGKIYSCAGGHGFFFSLLY
jgi:hypothetical protein